MISLTRTVRFSATAAGAEEAAAGSGNGFAGVPRMVGLGAHYELDITTRGQPHPETGYFLDIKVLDRAARGTIIPHIVSAFRTRPLTNPVTILHEPGATAALAAALAPDLAPRGGSVVCVLWRITPFYSVEVIMHPQSSTHAGPSTGIGTTIVRQRFEIAAAHRLHVPGLSDAQNRATFGKCNNPSGHGHNYVIEPAVVVDHAKPMPLGTIEALVHEHIIDPFDHTHLNVDRPEFDFTRGGVNPSVEHIAEVFYKRLAGPIASAGARLAHITVWETEKTSATFGEQ